MRRMSAMLAAVVLSFSLSALPSMASERVALVIGNAVYAHAPRLANPLNDIADIGAALERLGFAVTRLENAGRSELWDGLQKFALAASASEVAVVFYAGHGIEVDQRNFLVPVDARLASDRDVEFETVPLELVSRAVERARGLRVVILDACRENPFAASMQRAGATRSIGRGLARVEPSGETLVAYAAKEGTVASDGEGRNSPYSAALLKHLEEPGLEVGLMFRKVRDAVLAATGGVQEPFVYGSLSSKGVYLASAPAPAAISATASRPNGSGNGSARLTAEQLAAKRLTAEEELLFWKTVKDSASAANVRAYLDRYPEGAYAVLARNLLEQLENGTLTVETVPLGAQVRISGKDYRDSMRLKNGDYEVFIEAEGHEPFRSRLTIEGSTAYKISLCSLENETKRLNWEGRYISFFEFLEENYRESKWVDRRRHEEWEYIDRHERRFDNSSAESRELTKKVVKNRARKELLSEIKKNHKSRRDFMISECNNHYMKYSKGGSIEILCYKLDPFVFRSHMPEEPKEVTDHNFACVAILLWECISDDKVPVCPETIVTRLE